MSNDVLVVAYRERARLQAELSALPAWHKLQQVQKLISTYEAIEGVSDNAKPAASKPFSLSTHRKGSKVAMVDEIISRYLEKTGKRASSGDLLPIVQEAGIGMTGKVPAKTLSSFLTTSQRFNNLKGFGYGLAEWGDSPEKPSSAWHLDEDARSRMFDDRPGSAEH
jgi:hypothetical protein